MDVSTVAEPLNWSNDYADGGMANFADTAAGRYLIIEDFRWSFAGGAWQEGARTLEEAKAACQEHHGRRA